MWLSQKIKLLLAWHGKLDWNYFNVSIKVTSTSFLKIEIRGTHNFVEKKMGKDELSVSHLGIVNYINEVTFLFLFKIGEFD